MLELVTAGGWLMVLIMLCSVVVLAICIERLYTLNPKKIAPPHLLATVWKQLKAGEIMKRLGLKGGGRPDFAQGLNRLAQARLAELEIFRKKATAEAAGDPEKLAEIEEKYRIDRGRIESRLESKITKIREGDS